MRIRQIALVAADLDRTLEDLCAVFGLEVGFRDPGVGVFGLRNGVIPVGEHFLEVVSPEREGTSAGRYLERRRGDGGYMVILQARDLAAARRRVEERGVGVVWEIELEDMETAHLHPRGTGGALVSLDATRPAGNWPEWRWAGPDWRDHVRTDRVRGLAGVEIQSDDPSGLASRWADLFDLPRSGGRDDQDGDGNRLLFEDGGFASFVPTHGDGADGDDRDDRGEGVRSIALQAVDAAAVRRAAAKRGLVVDDDGAVILAGVRFVLVGDGQSA